MSGASGPWFRASATQPPNTVRAIFLGLCPQCGQGPLFDGYIAVRKACPACHLDYSIFDPGDGPAVFGILIVCLIRAYAGHFSPTHHLGFEFAAWYWHFVDVVWLFLFACIYVWGGGTPLAH